MGSWYAHKLTTTVSMSVAPAGSSATPYGERGWTTFERQVSQLVKGANDTSWRRLGGLHERLWLESGSSTPYLRSLLQGLESLSGSNLRVSLGELAGGKRLRLQLVEENADQLEAPPYQQVA